MRLYSPPLIGRGDAGGEKCAMASSTILASVLAAFLLIMLWLGGANIDALQAAFCFVGALVVVTSGELLLRLAGLGASPVRVHLAVVCGATATSLAILAGVL